MESRRGDYNRRFVQARTARPNLDENDFLDLLSSTVDPIISAVDGQDAERTGAVAGVLYDLSLDLLARGLLGRQSRYPFIGMAWKRLLPSLAAPLAASPQSVAGSITNAVYTISLFPGARPQEWIDVMSELAALCPDSEVLLEAGKVVAWRCGLAHYRMGALAICRRLDPEIGLKAVGVKDKTMPLGAILDRLDADPWLLPSCACGASGGPRRLKIVARVGGFRGFGGPFVLPPLVQAAGDFFYARDGETIWLLAADVFGATFHRSGDVVAAPPARLQIESSGKVTDGSLSAAFHELANASSWASTATTLAVTLPLSFSISLVAAAEP